MVIQFEFENKKKKKFSGGGIFLMPYSSSYGERQNGVVGSGISEGAAAWMTIDEERKLLLEALNAPTTNEPRSPRSSDKRSDSSAGVGEVSGSGFVQVKL